MTVPQGIRAERTGVLPNRSGASGSGSGRPGPKSSREAAPDGALADALRRAGLVRDDRDDRRGRR